NRGQRGQVTEHVGVGGIGQGTVALAGLDTAAQLIGPGTGPDCTKVVVVFAQIAHGFGANTAGPDITVGRDLRGGHAGHAGNHLAALHQCALDQVVIAVAKGLSDARDAAKPGPFAHARLQTLDHRLIALNGWSNAYTNRIQLHALLGNLADKRIGFQVVAHKGIDRVKFINIEVRDNRVNAEREVLVAVLERLETGVGAHGAREVATHAAHGIVFFAHAVQREINNHLASRRGLQHTLDARRDNCILNPVCRDIDDAGAAVAIRRLNNLRQILAQGWLAAAEGKPVGGSSKRGEGLLILLQGEIIVWSLPDIAGFAARVAAIADADSQIERQGQRPAQRVRSPRAGDFR